MMAINDYGDGKDRECGCEMWIEKRSE